MSADGLLPRRYPGHQTRRSMLQWRERIDRFCTLILQINSTLDFAVGSRGCCCILERHGLLKGDFDAAQRLITDCRKSGDLPLDICAEDASRETIGIAQTDYNDIETEADEWIDHLRNRAHEQYTPISNADFIDQHALTWIDNLETSSGQRLDDARHKDNGKRYVRKYIEQFGARKCEANALVVEPEIGRDLCRSAILEHVPADALARYNDALERARDQLHQAILERIA